MVKKEFRGQTFYTEMLQVSVESHGDNLSLKVESNRALEFYQERGFVLAKPERIEFKSKN